MNKLSLFKSGDLFNLIRDALLEYDGMIESEDNDLYECYDIECEDVYKNSEHYIIVKVFETSEHFPWQVGDVERKINNQFRIKIECIARKEFEQ